MATGNNQSSTVLKIVGAIIGLLVICSCVVIVAAGVIAYQAFIGINSGSHPNP